MLFSRNTNFTQINEQLFKLPLTLAFVFCFERKWLGDMFCFNLGYRVQIIS